MEDLGTRSKLPSCPRGQEQAQSHQREHRPLGGVPRCPRQGHSPLSSLTFLFCLPSPKTTPNPETPPIPPVFPPLNLEEGDRVNGCFRLKRKTPKPLWNWESKERKGLILWGRTQVSIVATSLSCEPRHHLIRPALQSEHRKERSPQTGPQTDTRLPWGQLSQEAYTHTQVWQHPSWKDVLAL